MTRLWDGTARSQPEDVAVRSASVTGTLAGGAAGPDALMASRGGSSADRAVTELYAMQYRSLVRLAALLVRDVQTAEEVVQDSFAAMHGGWQQLRDADADAALAFMRQAVVNRSRSVLRHRPVPGSSLRQVPPGVSGEHRARVARVARALIAVGALDGEVAEQILVDFELALATRQAGSPGQRGPGLGSWMRSPPVGRRPAIQVSSRPPADAPGSAGPQATPGRVVRLGQMIPVRGEDAGGEICLMSYAQTASGPQLSLLARVCYQSGPSGGRRLGPVMPPAAQPGTAPAWPQPEVPFLEQFTATDDRGTRYQMRVRDLGGGPDGWTLMLDPDPPYDPRWLDLTTTPGHPAVRIDLNLSPRPPEGAVTVSAATASPGEHLLHAVAARLLAAPPAGPSGTRLHPAAPGPGPVTTVADGLGDIIAALQAAGALSPLSPVPGQLAALCASLHLSGHGITVPPALDLPEGWLSMLAHHHRRNTRTDPARDGCAAAAVAFPDLDGLRLAILGLHTCLGDTVVHMHASGPMCHAVYGPDDLYYLPVIWIRDSGGHWHATRTRGRSGIGGEIALRLQVVPPLRHDTTWIEVLAAGQSAEARTTLALRWQ
jgi:DNA-directed RNA polymerase specialized sigma24 family protein